MKPLFARWLAVMLALCLFLSLAPAALTEEAPENAVFEEAEAVADEDVETQPDGDAADQEVVSEPVDAVPEEGEDIDLSDLPMFEAQSNDDDHDLDALEAKPADDGEGAGVVSAAAEGIAINKTNFPDDAFRAYVSDIFDRYAYDEHGDMIYGETVKDGILDSNEIRNATYIDVDGDWDASIGGFVGMGIHSLQGIEFFTNLKSLSCDHNQLTTLDVSGCPSLEELSCYNNQLTKLDVSGCPSLEELSCENNQLTKLDVSGCPSLEELWCFENQLTKLDVSGCPLLFNLRCANNLLPSLDIRNNQKLYYLDCASNRLISLNIENNTELCFLEIYDNNIKEIDISNSPYLVDDLGLFRYDDDLKCNRYGYFDGNLGSLFLVDKTVKIIPENTPVVSIDSEHFPDNSFREYISENVDKDKNGIVSKYEIIGANVFEIENMNISSLQGIEYFTALSYLYCNGNMLKSIDVSKNTALKEIHCNNNQITALDISNCPDVAQQVIPENFKLSDDKRTVIYTVSHWAGGWFERLVCDASVQIIGGSPVKTWADPSPDPAPASAPEPAPVSPSEPSPDPAPEKVISAANKTSRAAITAAPGTVCTLDLGGATGKKFKSSKKKVATVNAAGQVTVKGAGKTKITFKVGKKTRTVNLTVKDPTIPTSVMLSASSTAVKKGDVITLTPVIPEGTNTTFKWKSSNKKVATVSNGVVTFKKAGKVTITCTAVRGKKKVKVKFKVSN